MNLFERFLLEIDRFDKRRSPILSILLSFLLKEDFSPVQISIEQTKPDGRDLWHDGKIRAFVSHNSSAKKQVTKLSRELNKMGVDCFIAHDDIAPSKKWASEILLALSTCDIVIAYLTDDFFQSPWTNQEIGYAIARKKQIISLIVGNLLPQGFIAEEQGLKKPGQYHARASAIVKCIEGWPNLRPVRAALLSLIHTSRDCRNAKFSIRLLGNTLESISAAEAKQLMRFYNGNLAIQERNVGRYLVSVLNSMSPLNFTLINAGTIKRKW